MKSCLLALLVAMLCCLSAPVRAAVCDGVAEQLDDAELERIAAPVRDGFPSLYKNVLGDVRLKVSDEPGYQTYFEDTPQGGEITVPSYMPRYLCMLQALAAVVQNTAAVPVSPEQEARMNALENPCPDEDESDRCLQPALEMLYDAVRPQMASMTPEMNALVLLLAQESLKASLAHEFGHAIIDNGYADARRQALVDHEEEADLLALFPQFGSRALPMADTFMLNSMLAVERINKQSRVQTGVHDLTACRVLRLQTIKQAVMPQVNELAQWRPGNVFPALAPSSNPFNFRYDEMEGCSTEIPSEIVAFQNDLATIRAVIDAMPNGQPTAETFATLVAFQPATMLGATSRSLLFLRVTNSIAVPPISQISTDATRLAVQLRAKQLSEVLLQINPDELPSASQRDTGYVLAYLEFIQLPAETKVTEAARLLIAAQRRADDGVSATIPTLTDLASVQALAADCADATETAAQARAIHRKLSDELSPLTGMANFSILPFPPHLVPLADHREAIDRGEVSLNPAVCDGIRLPAAALLKERLGWVD